jgi:O-antigen/teichoic acid export membrane protein
MSLAAFGAVVLLLPYLQRPALEAHLSIFGLILLGSWARVGADQYGFVLLALHRDKAILTATAIGVAASVLLNVILLPALGLAGAASAFLLTGLTVLALCLAMSRNPFPNQAVAQTS